MRRPTGGVLVLCVQLASCWVTLPTDFTERKVAWPTPENMLSDNGLGGGLAYAVDPNFCDNILPMFKEDDGGEIPIMRFVTCEEINDSIARAMTTWSLNHPYLDFYNVTDECNAEDNGLNCSLAELYIQAQQPTADSTDVAAFVLHNPTDAGRYYGDKTWQTGVRMPSGETVEDDWVIQFTTMTFHNHICWYLDETFCAKFRILNENLDATLLMQFIIWGVWALSFLILFLRIAQIFFFVFRFGAKTGFKRAVQSQAKDMLYTYVLLFCLISPPIIWFKIFIPCLTCYDFEATAAHEIGHVLGFTHPDSFPKVHRVEKKNFEESICESRYLDPDFSDSQVTLSPSDPDINDSIMFHLTTKKSKSCLTHNDLQGLLFQYPVCNSDLIRTGEVSICVKQRRNIGWVRFLTATVPPFVFASLGVFILVQIALYYENKEQTKNRWKLAGMAAVQEGRKRKEEGERKTSIFSGRRLSQFGTMGGTKREGSVFGLGVARKASGAK